MTPTRLRSYADHQSYYKKVLPRVDSRWLCGTPKIRRSMAEVRIVNNDQGGLQSSPFSTRRNSESDLSNVHLESVSDSSSSSSCVSVNEGPFDVGDSVGEAHSNSVEEAHGDSENPASVSASSETSIETVSDHFRTLFQQLEEYMKTAADDKECVVIRKRMNKMKDTMSTINVMFEDLLNDGERLGNYLMDRRNNNVT